MMAILFISIFALDAFAPGLSFWQQITDFLMHLIPSFIMLLILIISWKRELFGGIVFTILGIVFTPIIFTINHRNNHSVGMSLGIISMITIPFIIVGILFLWSYFLKKKNKAKNA
jgi:hypothetical protein